MFNDPLQQYWPRIIETMNDGLVVIGSNGAIRMVNPALERMTGYSRDELIGQPCTIFRCDACETLRHDGRDKWCRLFDDPENRPVQRHCDLITKTGTILPVLKNAVVFHTRTGKLLGAVETVTDISEVLRRDRKIEDLSRRLAGQNGWFGMIGESPAMRRVYTLIEKAAASDAPVIVYGESGTGKELAARAIHQLGERRNGPFIQLNCAALNESLFESEVFGHVRGAFTGAYRHRPGRFELADGGDLFLDEIGEIPITSQVKLLRVLETKQVERVGDSRPVSVDIRIIAATNRNLTDLVRQGLFREDLFFRINVIPINLPPLRERLEDIPLILEFGIKEMAARTGKAINGVCPEALAMIMKHGWPGNVRELLSTLHYAFVVAEEGLIRVSHLPDYLHHSSMTVCREPAASSQSVPSEKSDLIEALRQTCGNQTQTARLLGVTRTTVWNRMRKYRIEMAKIMNVE